MHTTLQEICDSLDSLAQATLDASASDEKISDQRGWNQPHLTRHDLAFVASDLSDRIKKLEINDLADGINAKLEVIPGRLEVIESSVVPNFYNGHSKDAVAVFFTTINWINLELSPLFNWERLKDNKLLPPQLSKRLTDIQSGLDNLMPDKSELEKSLRTIREATDTIESLPSDIETLKQSKKVIEKAEKDSTLSHEKISEILLSADKLLFDVKHSDVTAKKIVEQCEDAYRITTTKGLAASFELRAKELNQSMWGWVGLLLVSLVVGGIIGSSRFESITTLLKDNKDLNTGFIVMEFVLAVLSIGAPIWFAWIATKQIGQRFKLSEDYGFKASVAKAYEGFKKEAIRIDEKLEHRLFSSALTRLEEAPLRLMDDKTHGSPWHELFESNQIKSAGQELLNVAKEKIPTVGKRNGTPVLKEEEEE